MSTAVRPAVILVAEDDADDRLLARDAFERSHVDTVLQFVEDGEDLLDYLRCSGKYDAPGAAPRPGLILLDLNMPRKDGREALREIKADPALRTIPVVVLTTSNADQDVTQTYDLGANSFITKPVTFQGLVDVMQTLDRYWFHMVALPSGTGACARP